MSALAAPLLLPALARVALPEAPAQSLRAAVIVALDGAVPGSSTDEIRGAEAAALELKARLTSEGFQSVTVLLGEHATRPALKAAWQDVSVALRPGDLGLLYVITHGATCPDSGDAVTQYLRLAETQQVTGASCWQQAVTDTELHAWVSGDDGALGDRILVLDACRSPEPPQPRDGAPADTGHPWSWLWRDTLVLRSTSGALVAYAEREGMPLYTRYFIDGIGPDRLADLNHDGAVTGLEAHDYAAARLEVYFDEHPSARLHGVQIPMRTDQVTGVARKLALTGTPGPPERNPTHGGVYTPPWEYRVVDDRIANDLLMPLGPSGDTLVPQRGRLILTAPGETRPVLSVLGLEQDTGSIAAWHPGRMLGRPSWALGAGVSELMLEEREIVEGAGDCPATILARMSGASADLRARRHDLMLPNLGLDAEAWISGTDLDSSARAGLALAPGGELHWRRLTLRAAPRVEGLLVYTPDELGTGPSPTIACAADIPVRANTLGGAELGVRLGLTRTLALSASATWGRGLAVADPLTPSWTHTSATLSLLVDWNAR